MKKRLRRWAIAVFRSAEMRCPPVWGKALGWVAAPQEDFVWQAHPAVPVRGARNVLQPKGKLPSVKVSSVLQWEGRDRRGSGRESMAAQYGRPLSCVREKEQTRSSPARVPAHECAPITPMRRPGRTDKSAGRKLPARNSIPPRAPLQPRASRRSGALRAAGSTRADWHYRRRQPPQKAVPAQTMRSGRW